MEPSEVMRSWSVTDRFFHSEAKPRLIVWEKDTEPYARMGLQSQRSAVDVGALGKLS